MHANIPRQLTTLSHDAILPRQPTILHASLPRQPTTLAYYAIPAYLKLPLRGATGSSSRSPPGNHTHTYTHTPTHTHTQRERHTHTHTYIDTHKYTQAHTHTHTHAYTHRQKTTSERELSYYGHSPPSQAPRLAGTATAFGWRVCININIHIRAGCAL